MIFLKMHFFRLSMRISLLAGLSLLFSIALADDPEYGSARGKLVIIGGGSTAGTGIMERFVSLGGGTGKKFIIVPTANGNRNGGGSVRVYNRSQVIGPWVRMGIKNVHMLHTHSPKIADTEDFVKELRDADAVWFDGGRQWHIVDSYAGTRTYAEFHKLLDRGGTIGGSSAGATIQGEYLVRGDTAGPHIIMTKEPNHQKGFAFLHRSAIDQHINTRNRWDDLTLVIAKYPRLLGIGLSEGTAIIVRGDSFEVMGKAKVAIHDNTRKYKSGEKPYYLLAAGDRYNMKTRRKIG
jgi:cyanophycinase